MTRKKKILLTIVAVPLVLLAVLLIVVALQPADFRITRSATVNAPPAKVFPHVNDFHNWKAWSPWAPLDPNAKNTFEGPESGKGAIFRWSGNSEVGEGGMTITDSRPDDLVRIQIDFKKPFEATNVAEFTFKPQGTNQTQVTWTMSGTNNFIGKAFCLFVNMDKMLGAEFDKGLATMKSVVEKNPQQEGTKQQS